MLLQNHPGKAVFLEVTDLNVFFHPIPQCPIDFALDPLTEFLLQEIALIGAIVEMELIGMEIVEVFLKDPFDLFR